MSKQTEAPGDLEHVRAFVNTIDLESGEEQLGTPAKLASWLVQHDLGGSSLRATAAELRHALALREALRAALLCNHGGDQLPAQAVATLDQAARRARVSLRFGAQAESALVPGSGGVAGALGRLLAIVHGARATGDWSRLKACREHTCEWAFYDHTKNRSGAWCNMAVCGNRAKARAYRERRARMQ